MTKHGSYLLSSICNINLHTVPILPNILRIIPIYLVTNWNTKVSSRRNLRFWYTFSWTEAKYIIYFCCKGNRKRTLGKPKHVRKDSVKTDGYCSGYSHSLGVGRFAFQTPVGKINFSLAHNYPHRLRGPTQILIQCVTRLLLGGKVTGD
jgi:hypothetical protein